MHALPWAVIGAVLLAAVVFALLLEGVRSVLPAGLRVTGIPTM